MTLTQPYKVTTAALQLVSLLTKSPPHSITYRTAGNIGGQLNLAVWRLGKRPSNLNLSNLSPIYACACVHIIYTELPPNLNPPIFLFRPLGIKPPNLKIANISGYTVLAETQLYKLKHKSTK